MSKRDSSIALSQEIDAAKVRSLQHRIDRNSTTLDEIVNRLVRKYCEGLDKYVNHIQTALMDERNPPTDYELDNWAMNLPVFLYFTGEGQEALGVKEDIAKAIRMELYNETRSNAAGTVADKDSVAEMATQVEFLTHTAYSRAYKKIKLRMEYASEILQSVKKVISRRMVEYELARVDPMRIQGAKK